MNDPLCEQFKEIQTRSDDTDSLFGLSASHPAGASILMGKIYSLNNMIPYLASILAKSKPPKWGRV